LNIIHRKIPETRSAKPFHQILTAKNLKRVSDNSVVEKGKPASGLEPLTC
jgi:hypothetical protein